MKLLRRICSSRHFWPLLIVIGVGILAGKGLIGRGYFNMHDDLQMMRQLQMEKCFLDRQIPCRWVPDMGYGFGFPLFNFYPPLPYLVGEGIRLLGFSFTATAKMLFIAGFVASGITMYFLAGEFFGRMGGVLSSVFFVWAPYHAVDAYVRGAMNESWALVWFPLILWSGYKLVLEKEKPFKWVITLSLGWFALFTSHNLMVLAFGPVFAVWILFWMVKEKAWAKISSLLISGVFSAGLAAFFTIPALLENKFTHIDSVLIGYYDYSAHFPSIKQLLFSRFWGYGPSVWMDIDDGMSFQVGHVHWIGSIFMLGILISAFLAKKNRKKFIISPWVLSSLFFFVVGWFTLFLVHPRSTFIWQIVTPLKYLQFSWRLLGVVILCFSFVIGAVIKILTTKYKVLSTVLLSIALVALNWNYFKPEHGRLGKLTDQEKLSGAAWDLQQTAGIYDYLPIYAKEAPKEPRKYIAEILRGEGIINFAQQGTSWINMELDMDSEGVVRIDTFKFPGWEVWVNDKKVEPFIPDYEIWGRMHIAVDPGKQTVKARFVNTPVRTVSNVISLISWGALVSVPIWRKKIGLS